MGVKIDAVIQAVERIAPKSWAEEWDNVGLLVGSGRETVDKILLALDGTPEVIEEARALGAQLIMAHHPIMFRPLKNLRSDNAGARLPIQLLKNGIAFYAAHTNLDQSELSSSWSIGKSLQLADMEILATIAAEKLVKLVIYVPPAQVEQVRQALVEIGVGESVTEGPNSELYAECFFQSQGEGSFRPLAGANPTLGKIGDLARVTEVKLESIMPERLVERAVRAIRRSHPYEEPAYDIIPLYNSGARRGFGVIGYLPEARPLQAVWQDICVLVNEGPWAKDFSTEVPPNRTNGVGLRLAGDLQQTVRKVAIVNGSGGSFVSKALFKGADLLITGDVDHHAVLEAMEGGMAVADIGHYWSEIPMVYSLAEYLKGDKTLRDIEIVISQANKLPWTF